MRVIISAGGTGGHIYPALAIINKIKENEKDSEILYIGTHNRMENELIPKLGIPYKSIKIIGFNRKNILSNFKTIFYFLGAIKKAKKIIREFNPDVVIGVGGYVTGPVIYAAKKLGYKTFVHEQNSTLGMTNKFLLKYANIMAVSFEKTKNCAISDKVIYTGNPSSEDATKKAPFDKSEFGLSLDKKLVVIVMGSLGSDFINNKMIEILPLFYKKEYEVIFITGKDYYNSFISMNMLSNVKILSYIDDLSRLMKVTDLMVSRAGATTMSEIIALNIPTILVPSPYVADNHQYNNALSLSDKGAAILLEEKDFNGKTLVELIDKLLSDEVYYNNIKNNLSLQKVPNSSTMIYSLIKKLVDGGNDDKHN